METEMNNLNSTEESERLYAVQDIIDLKDKADQYAETLVRHLAKETSQAVRESVVFALKRIPCTRAFPLLFDLFQAQDAYLRNAAVAVFGTKEVNGVAFLTSLLDHTDREVRKLILDALFQIGSKEAVPAIRAGLHDSSVNVRITAVEYLGQLNDQESVPDILEMLAHEPVPMLITSALETILQIGNAVSVQETIKFLNPNDDIKTVDPIFLPELIRLVSRCGSLEPLLKIIEFLNGRQAYARDIVLAIEDARKSGSAVICEPGIIRRLIRIIKDPGGVESVRYAASELLLTEGYSDTQMLGELGEFLVNEPGMMNAGIRLLTKSGTEKAGALIQKILAETKDPGLSDLFEDIE